MDVVERIGRVDGEADEDDVRVGVGEGTETIVIFLTGGIPKGKLYMATIDLDIGDVVLEDGGDVYFRESTLWRSSAIREIRDCVKKEMQGEDIDCQYAL